MARRLLGKPAFAVRRWLAGRYGGVRGTPVRRVLLDTRTVALRDLVDREAERVGLSVVRASTYGDHEAGTASCPDDHVLRVRRAMHEVPRAQVPLLAFDDENCFPRDDEEVLLIGLLVVQGHRFARPEHERIDAELVELAPAFEIVGDDADGAAAVGVTPLGVAHVEDEPSLAPRDEPVLGLLQFRLGNHGLEACRNGRLLRNAFSACMT
jgi:hypothetical protein